MANISFQKVRKTYPNGVTVVPELDLEIRDQEFVVLVGPSGCGKSTTLRMIAGLEEVSGGELSIGGKKVNDVPPKDRDIAMVFQSYALYPHMSVYKNMAFGLKLRKVPKDEIDRKVREAAEILELTPYLERKPRALSGGQRQRVALGRAMVRDPAVFLLDEPLSNLDAKLRTEMRSQITKLHQRLKTTFVYVTHDQTEAMTMGDRICVLKDGVVQQFDTPQALYQTPCNMFVAGFIGSPQMNFISAVLQREDGEYLLTFGGCRVRVPSGRVPQEELERYVGRTMMMGVRPEDIHGEESFLSTAPEGQFTAHVDLAELMGSEIYLYLTFHGQNLVARVPSRIHAESGQEVALAVDSNKIHLFDPETQRRVGR